MKAWKQWMAIVAVLALGVVGCGKTGERNSAASGGADQAGNGTGAAQPDDPAVTVTQFLDAIRTGNDQKAVQLLSPVARKKTAETAQNVTPPASDTARFEVGQIEYIGKDGARVACTWTDLDENGKPRTDRALWVVRLEEEGWRVVGVAATVFDGEPPLLLNFEDPDDMKKKQEWLREEIARRSRTEAPRAQTGQNPQDSVRR